MLTAKKDINVKKVEIFINTILQHEQKFDAKQSDPILTENASHN